MIVALTAIVVVEPVSVDVVATHLFADAVAAALPTVHFEIAVGLAAATSGTVIVDHTVFVAAFVFFFVPTYCAFWLQQPTVVMFFALY